MTGFERSRRARRQSWWGAKKHVKRALALPGVHGLMRGALRGRTAEQKRRLPAPAGLREVTAQVDGASFVMLRPDRCEIAKEIYWGSGTRPDPQDAYALELVSKLSRHADAFYDIGAYTGVFTLAVTAASPDLRAHAFELIPPVARALGANVVRNDVQDRVTVHPYGLGDPSHTMVAPTADHGSALPSFLSADSQHAHGTEVGFVALDDFVGEPGEKVVMKVDVEGAEPIVFAHGREFLRRHRPDILCEVLPDADIAAIEAELVDLAPHTYVLAADRLIHRERLVADPGHRDWLLSPRSPEELRGLGVTVEG